MFTSSVGFYAPNVNHTHASSRASSIAGTGGRLFSTSLFSNNTVVNRADADGVFFMRRRVNKAAAEVAFFY
jgi:hypothetical protein